MTVNVEIDIKLICLTVRIKSSPKHQCASGSGDQICDLPFKLTLLDDPNISSAEPEAH